MFLPPGFHERSITTSLGKMVYYTAQGEPWESPAAASQETLVFLHGFGGGSSAYEWSKVYPALAAEYQILAPDLIGWGRSEHPARSYQAEDYIGIITEFMEQTCSKATTVIASALTAAFTIRAAINRPELFKSLILTTAAGLAEFGQDYRRSGFAQFAQSVNVPFLNQLLYGAGVANSLGVRGFLEQRQFAQADRVYPEIVEAYVQSAQQKNAEYAALSFVRGDLCFDLSQYITQLTVPTALIWGKGSEFTSPEIGRRLMEMNPQAIRCFYQLDEFGFTPQLEMPAVTLGLIRKFLPMLEKQVVVNP
ncbi:MAG: alpha/beta hydrolase [Pegethrix bostrychoides GSE-TBD4-15B]|jgi:pimeloyl-ACP methyl ester carboxylesterase|uniref:Alpha/beta hydrolase n=1 Tax=Pegethrix bostrychoides GSE-TBD4-15B TaxID=2839662 RepID=A0A951P8Y0_9CYAN|nr:alpha/beta hydrolase [Pegethrix bostrychoides GSE-TBD4-15B]